MYVATDIRRSEALGMKWSLIRWDEGAIELGWVVVEEGNEYRLRKLTKDGDDNAVIYVDQSVMNVLKWQKRRQDAGRARLGDAWVDHDLVFARDGFKLYRGAAGGPQDPEKVTNDLEAGENPRGGLRERPASLAGLHDGPVRALSEGRSAEARRLRSGPDRPVRPGLGHDRWAVGHVVGHATAQKTEKPQMNWGLCWCPRGDLNPHAR
ncbi:hypothetical protein I5Q34_20570 [Streptomyces sp. AV19]|uniref:hypothetical protein n=1 Tax=Streptomyces sp. AV19 TaxID=2793068 RepID=UPI0018FE3869|nr:hypothetical protein [Streptomyces sp. AV19]MBH1936641.1 hypothetical protein [Streptomyces sp. AV19]MDG4532702.1 hypothetical protein [Streptomyces sp. AV19]